MGIKKVLGIEVEQDPQKEWVFLSQKKFAEHILQKLGMEHCNPAPTPALPNFKLSKSMCPKNDDEKEAIRHETIDYRSAACSLLFLTHTHPELCYPVSQVAKFVQNPGKEHFQALKRILRYVQGHKHFGLLFKKPVNEDVVLTAFCDADWAGGVDDKRSTTGHVCMINGNVVSFKSKHQASVALSSCEAETTALCSAAQEIAWLR